jgi:two-component system OmpR family sensor kinase
MWCHRPMPSAARTLARLPIRLRLTLAFTIVIALVLGVAGFFLVREFQRDLDRSINDSQRAQAADIAALVAGPRGPAAIPAGGERYAQAYASDGRLLASTTMARGGRLVLPHEIRAAGQGPLVVERRDLEGVDLRVRGVPAQLESGGRVVVAVGESLDRRDDSLTSLRRLLLIALPVALLVAAFAGYEVAGAALRPVERMQSRAAEISERNPSERLPLPEANDEIGRLGRTLNSMLDRLERALARERRLVGDASHELRTPLTTLRAELELALRGQRDADELRASIASAEEEARRMSILADDLLVLARADQGKLPIRAEPLAAGELLVAAARRAEAAVAEAGRSITAADQTPGGAVVLADPDRVAQALDNLITNSLRYGDGAIELDAVPADGTVELHVMDSGVGFDDAFLDRAFERFSRDAGGAAAPQGAGLGLAIVDAVARAHGGKVSARNRPAGGADVCLALPEA